MQTQGSRTAKARKPQAVVAPGEEIASPSLGRTFLLVEWTLIVIHVAVIAINSSHNIDELTVRHGAIAFATLGGCGLLSFFLPVGHSLWERRVYIFLEILILLPTQALTFWGFGLFLYLFLAKSCFLLSRRDVIFTAIATGVVWLGVDAWRSPAAIEWAKTHMPDYWADPQHLIIANLINNTGVYIAACTFILLLSFTVVAERKSHQKAIALTQEVEALAAALERTRIARDIHDSLGHTLTTLDVQLELAQRLRDRDPSKSSQALDTAKDLASQSLTEVRRAVSAMREENFDLNRALATLVERFQRDRPFKINLQANFPQLPLQTSHQLYCIVQEALTNIEKHSRASRVLLRGYVTGEALVLDLADNGVGFDPERQSSGFGLRGMQERVQMLGGEFKIESNPNRGTQIEVKLKGFEQK